MCAITSSGAVRATRSSAKRSPSAMLSVVDASAPRDRSVVDGRDRSRASKRRRRLTPKMAENGTNALEEARQKENAKAASGRAVQGENGTNALGEAGRKKNFSSRAASPVVHKENIDHDEELGSGSRVLALCVEGREWKATIRRSHVKNTGERGYKIHYDGMKRSVEYWVPVNRVVALLDKAGRRRKLRQVHPTKTKKRRLPNEQQQSMPSKKEMSYPPDTLPPRKPCLHETKSAKDNLSDHAAGDKNSSPRKKLFFRVGYFCDDFDLFDGELLRTASWDEVLKDL